MKKVKTGRKFYLVRREWTVVAENPDEALTKVRYEHEEAKEEERVIAFKNNEYKAVEEEPNTDSVAIKLEDDEDEDELADEEI